jgi:hypothetical protein
MSFVFIPVFCIFRSRFSCNEGFCDHHIQDSRQDCHRAVASTRSLQLWLLSTLQVHWLGSARVWTWTDIKRRWLTHSFFFFFEKIKNKKILSRRDCVQRRRLSLLLFQDTCRTHVCGHAPISYRTRCAAESGVSFLFFFFLFPSFVLCSSTFTHPRSPAQSQSTRCTLAAARME